MTRGASTILTLSLCIGANSAIFTVVRSVLLRPLPYPESDRLVFMFDAFPGAGVERAGTSVPNYIDRRALTDVLDSVALYRFGGFRVGEGTDAEGGASYQLTRLRFASRNEAADIQLLGVRVRTAIDARASGNALVQYNSTTNRVDVNVRLR